MGNVYANANHKLDGCHAASSDNLYAANLHAATAICCFHGRIPDCDNAHSDYADSDNTHGDCADNDHANHDDAKQDDYSQCSDFNQEEIQEEVYQKEVWMLLRGARLRSVATDNFPTQCS